MNRDLGAFVGEALGRGVSREQIRAALAEAGWRPDEVDAALAAWADTALPIPVPRRRPYLSAREAFLYLVMFVTLYTTAFNVGALLFDFIERWLPDPALQRFADRSLDGVRNAAAGLLIAFPIFLALSAYIGRTIRREPEKRGSRIRKWLTYVTLFLAALVILGDLTVLVQRVLAGELAPRFLLKVTVVFAIAGTVFGHYLGQLRQEEREDGAPAEPRTGWPGRVAAVAVVVVMVAGLVVAGSPRRERQRQIDAERIEDLRALSRAIQAYRQDQARLPDSLGQLAAFPDAFGARAIRDPKSGAPYGYRPLDSLRYELCAEFDAAAERVGNRYAEPGLASEFWRHGAGPHCFVFQLPRTTTAPPR